jgi:hypothetical protein
VPTRLLAGGKRGLPDELARAELAAAMLARLGDDEEDGDEENDAIENGVEIEAKQGDVGAAKKAAR